MRTCKKESIISGHSAIRWVPAILWLCVASTCPAGADTPVLYSESTHQSPLRADPDDLILLPGYGFASTDQVVYQALGNSTARLVHPVAVPETSTRTLGVADVVSAADAPYALAIHLPTVTGRDQTYALWVWNGSAWSNGVRINDARPLWITPDSSYATVPLANLPRVLKVVGRNLEPAPRVAETQVRLSGSTTYTLRAVADSSGTTGASDPVSTPQIKRYVAKVMLPARMRVGTYTVQVSRDDGASWVPLLGENDKPPQTFTVVSDPVPPATFRVSDYGCRAETNALVCVVNAIHAAQAAGGGTVLFGPGVWSIDLPSGFTMPAGCLYTPAGTTAPAVTCDGIILPPNVNLAGSVSATSANPAVLSRGPAWATASIPTFTLEGNNSISNLYFADQANYASWQATTDNTNTRPGAALNLGVEFWHAPGGERPGGRGAYSVFTPTSAISHVTITANVFDKPWIAIANGGLPIDHLVVSGNLFGGAFDTAIYLGQNPNNIWLPYRFDDSIVAFNSFYPSSNYSFTKGLDRGATIPANSSGPIATQLNTALREDFSNNIADGRSTRYFYDPTISPTNPKGWRAAYFWSTGNNQELTLVSQNQIFCSGDKAGDGEAIAYDGSRTLGGMLDVWGNAAAALPVIAAAPWVDPVTGAAGSTITVQGALVDPVWSAQQSLPRPATRFYPGRWLRILQGKGIGEWRKIISLNQRKNGIGATVAFNVAPALDVLPRAARVGGSIASMSPVYWQNATVDNDVDQSQAGGCTKSNQNYKLSSAAAVRPFPSGGSMTWFDSTADSAMEGNQQQDTSGILLYHFFSPPNRETSGAYAIAKTSSEIRNNLISDEYEWTSPYSSGGIQLGSGARAQPDIKSWNPADPVVTAFGITIAGNTITHADASNFNVPAATPMGAIGVSPGINENGPLDASGATAWKIADSTLIFHNTLSDIHGGGIARAAIGVAALSSAVPEVWRSVLYANACPGAQTAVIDYGVGTTDYCPAPTVGSCECSGRSSVDVSVAATTTSAVAAVGTTLTYVARVTNTSAVSTATRVQFSVEPSAGVAITGLTARGGTCDVSVNLCSLGTLPPGRSVPVTVTAVGVLAGAWNTVFSVTHGEPDPATANNGAFVTSMIVSAHAENRVARK